jgi:hypothetical protein
MVLADIKPEEADDTRSAIRKRAGLLGLEYNVVICLHITCSAIFHEYINVLPYYMNVQREGVVLHA